VKTEPSSVDAREIGRRSILHHMQIEKINAETQPRGKKKSTTRAAEQKRNITLVFVLHYPPAAQQG
jgi:hypothetical protein